MAERDLQREDSGHEDDLPRAREDTPIKLVFAVADVDAERSRLVRQGVKMFPANTWGTCDGLDPEGNVFQIARQEGRA